MTQATAEILSQGEELVTGEIADTNAAWLSIELIGLGFDVTRHTAVGDRLEALVDLLREISRRADLCLCTGGLGPTCDDLTAEAVSQAFERPLAMDPTALTQIEDWFSRMNRDMPSVNRKQAMLPAGATRLDNLWGTAPGFSVMVGRCRFFFMPGVPSEMKAMYQTAIRPELRRLYALAPPHRVVLRTLGLGESTLQELLNPIPLPDGTSLGFRAGGAENQVKLTFPPSLPEAAIDDTLDAVKQALGDAIYAITRNGKGPQSLIDVIGQGMAAKNARLYLVETLSGGNMATRCFGYDWLAGATLLTHPVKHLTAFDTPPDATHEESIVQWAKAIRIRETVDVILVQTGDFTLATLNDENTRLEIMTVVAGRHGIMTDRRLISGNRQRKQNTATTHGLNLLRRFLLAEQSNPDPQPE
jgi:competence/damage-inducible protein CinA-like protein